MLTIDRFSDFFRAVHGYAPFPWQKRLAEKALRGEAVESVSVPTSSGKTAILDAYVFALAAGAPVPRRIIHIVDRRVVVDDAHRRAEKIKAAIELGAKENRGSVLRDARDGLLALGGESPLETVLLRGGLYQEDAWIRHPGQPLIICSTVDQVGSRLLYQGYGVSPYMRSIHAGLLANDALVILDEAHCSEPFRQTLEAISSFRRFGESVPPTPFNFITMTATPSAGTEALALEEADYSDPVLSRRLTARKMLELTASEKPKDQGLAAMLSKKALESAREPGKTILVVANRVSLARAIAVELEAALKASKGSLRMEAPILLTGRSRPIERDCLLGGVAGRVYAGRDRSLHKSEPSLVLVATQCIEVGADLDVDVLVTEICPMDSLRQRLGRLDRLGELGLSRACCVAPYELAHETEGKPYEDPVYGKCVSETWKGLLRAANGGDLDGGIASFTKTLSGFKSSELAAMRAASPDAPIVIPAYCDLWSQTSPAPAAVPEPALFLHGIAKAEAEVQLVWRADLPEDRLDAWTAILSACPPVSGEALRLPLSRALAWLEGHAARASSGSDLESEEAAEDPGRRRTGDALLPFLRWTGAESGTPERDVRSIRPGDTIILAAVSGGCDRFGWAPDDQNQVADIADLARQKARRTPVLRLHPACTGEYGGIFSAVPLTQDEETKSQIDALIRRALDAANTDEALPTHYKEMLSALKDSKRLMVEPHPSGTGWLVYQLRQPGAPRDEASLDDESSSLSARLVPLSDHLKRVEETMRDFAAALPLPDALSSDLALAGKLHDLGKADPRFQALLWGGDRIRALKAGLLAKSPFVKGSGPAHAAARKRAGYPEGSRHELASLAVASMSRALDAAVDPDLVLHLIASHHGRCRPFAPVVVDEKPRSISVDLGDERIHALSNGELDGKEPSHAGSGVGERFWRLQRRYGWWGLAYLEACLRLADHRASELEEKGVSA